MEKHRRQSPSSPETNMRQTQLNSQSKRFYDAWSQYNEDQVAYRQRRKDQMLKKIKVPQNN